MLRGALVALLFLVACSSSPRNKSKPSVSEPTTRTALAEVVEAPEPAALETVTIRMEAAPESVVHEPPDLEPAPAPVPWYEVRLSRSLEEEIRDESPGPHAILATTAEGPELVVETEVVEEQEPPPPEPKRVPRCGVRHPDTPWDWVEAGTIRCRGLVHVLMEQADDEVLDAVFEEWERVLERVGEGVLRPLAGAPAPVTVYVFPSRADCMESIDLRFGAACYRPRIRSVMIGANQPWEGGLDRFRSVLRHELSHHLVHGVAREDVPSWMNEGLAEYMERSPGEDVRSRPIQTDFSVLFAWRPHLSRTSEENRARYHQSHVLVRTLLRNPDTAAAFVRLLMSEEPWPQDLEELAQRVGLSYSELLVAYRREATNEADQLSTRLHDPVAPGLPVPLWIVILGVPTFLVLPLTAWLLGRKLA